MNNPAIPTLSGVNHSTGGPPLNCLDDNHLPCLAVDETPEHDFEADDGLRPLKRCRMRNQALHTDAVTARRFGALLALACRAAAAASALPKCFIFRWAQNKATQRLLLLVSDSDFCLRESSQIRLDEKNLTSGR